MDINACGLHCHSVLMATKACGLHCHSVLMATNACGLHSHSVLMATNACGFADRLLQHMVGGYVLWFRTANVGENFSDLLLSHKALWVLPNCLSLTLYL